MERGGAEGNISSSNTRGSERFEAREIHGYHYEGHREIAQVPVS